jgi:hypothetical protein
VAGPVMFVASSFQVLHHGSERGRGVHSRG